MSKRKAFWGDSGAISRQVEGAVDGELLNMEVNSFGVMLINRVTLQPMRRITWAELHRVALLEVPTDAAPCPRCGGTRRIWAIPDNAPCPSCTEPIHGPLNESAGLRILPAEES